MGTSQIEQKLGFTPYNGTLNIRLNEKVKKTGNCWIQKRGLHFNPR